MVSSQAHQATTQRLSASSRLYKSEKTRALRINIEDKMSILNEYEDMEKNEYLISGNECFLLQQNPVFYLQDAA